MYYNDEDEDKKSIKEKIIEIATGKSALLFIFGIILIIFAQVFETFEILSISFIVFGILCGIGGIIRFFVEQEIDD